ncbi:MAG: tRNA (adenosine(37)-N6)-dimethylallyltransferase MiaA [Deltaproteobacteria bacterium]|jgi:tRNA dimethylallyltransferase|nr:tRNA (adenosine(37)-N6)-dimethylallyltransferase MiaA [Deltaproteobacteria bacterium]
MNLPKVIILTGPTGSGKSSLALKVAKALDLEIVNADSLAFYRGLDIGAAKPTASERLAVPHHLFDILEPDEDFDAAAYLKLARPIVTRLSDAGKPALVVGGTGLYLRSLTRGLFQGPGRQAVIRAAIREEVKKGADPYQLLLTEDPLAAAKLNPKDYPRVERALEVIRASGVSIVTRQEEHRLADQPFATLVLIIDRETKELDADLRVRTEGMFKNGLIAEVEGLLKAGFSRDLKPLRAIGYREAIAYLKGEMTLEAAKEQVYLRTRRLAKRQRTWFRGQTPEGLWVKPDLDLIIEKIQGFTQGGAGAL